MGSNALGQFATIDGEDAAAIARMVRGEGLLVVRKSLADACAFQGADCSDIMANAACIEWHLRRPTPLRVMRNVLDSFGVIRKEWVDADVVDVDAICHRLEQSGGGFVDPDEGVGENDPPQGPIDATDSRPRLFDPKLVFIAGAGALALAVAGVFRR